VAWVAGTPIWLAGTVLVVVGDRSLGFVLAGVGGVIILLLLVTRVRDPADLPDYGGWTGFG
jgi:hypothetical protein